VIAHLMGITAANNAGNIHGGTIMKLADEVAGLAAIKYSRQRVVTVGMDRMVFRVPIYVGELVTFKATVNAAWRTSMEIGVRVEAENPFTGESRHTNTAYLTMVALDSEGRPAPVPPALGVPDDGRARLRRPPGSGTDRYREQSGRAAPSARGRAAARQPAGRARADPRPPPVSRRR
jgi:acyl-CoA hydrolase